MPTFFAYLWKHGRKNENLQRRNIRERALGVLTNSPLLSFPLLYVVSPWRSHSILRHKVALNPGHAFLTLLTTTHKEKKRNSTVKIDLKAYKDISGEQGDLCLLWRRNS